MGFAHVTPLGRMTWFMRFDWFRHIWQLTRESELIVFTL